MIGTILLLIFELVLDKFSFSTLAGFMTGYAFYLLVHYSVHIFRPPNNILKELWKNHAIHHYKDDTHHVRRFFSDLGLRVPHFAQG